MFQSDTEGNFLFSVGNVRLCPHIQPLASRGNISYLAEIIAKYLTVIKKGGYVCHNFGEKIPILHQNYVLVGGAGEMLKMDHLWTPLAGWEG